MAGGSWTRPASCSRPHWPALCSGSSRPEAFPAATIPKLTTARNRTIEARHGLTWESRPSMTSGKALRDGMAEKGLVHIMATHSPISALLAEEAGFDGLWASGFELSALYGLPDMSLVTMTQHLEILRCIVGRSSLPVVADIETGFGNALNVIHAIREYERTGAAAVVIEDKTLPKVTSLAAAGRQE